MSTPATDIENRIKALEAKASAEESKIATWLKTNWAHFVTWLGVAMAFVKHL
jgi:hypothetical protein